MMHGPKLRSGGALLCAGLLAGLLPGTAEANQEIILGSTVVVPLAFEHSYLTSLASVDSFHVRVTPEGRLGLGSAESAAVDFWAPNIYLPVGLGVPTGTPGALLHTANLYVHGFVPGQGILIEVWEHNDYANADFTTVPIATGTYDVVAPTANLTVMNPGGGRVTSTNTADGIDCGSTCAATYTFSDNGYAITRVVRLHPAADAGYTFDRWSGPCASTPGDDCVVHIMDAHDHKTLTPVWLPPQPLTVTVSGDTTGSVTSAPAGINCPSGSCSKSFPHATVVTLTATPDPTGIFSGWTGCTANPAGKCEVTMDRARSVVAMFRKPKLTVHASTHGLVTSTPAGVNCATSVCFSSFPKGTSVVLTAAPTTPGYYFKGWSGACSGSGTCTVTMNSDKTADAIFFTPSVALEVRNTAIPVAWRDEARATVANAPPFALLSVKVRTSPAVQMALVARGPFGQGDLDFSLVADAAGKASSPYFYVRGKSATQLAADGVLSVTAAVRSPSSPAGPGPLATDQKVIAVRNIAYVDDRAYVGSTLMRPRNPANLPVDPRPGFGFRVFPELMSIADTAPPEFRRRRVFEASLDQPAPGMNIAFVVLDVDDPSSDPVVDPNGALGDDNLGTGGYFIDGTDKVTTYLDLVDAGGVAAVTLEFGSQPGDNYRVVAFPIPSDTANYDMNMGADSDLLVDGLDVYTNMPPLNADKIPLTNTVTSTSPACASELYTVWRKLHIERDSMAPVTAINANTGQVVSSATYDPVKQQTTLTITDATAYMIRDEYQNGVVSSSPPPFRPLHGWRLRIVSNTSNTIVAAGYLPAAVVVGTVVTVVDDDDMNSDDGLYPDGDIGEAFPPLDTTLLGGAGGSNRFEPAYIVPVFDLLTQESATIPFQDNIDTDDSETTRCLLPPRLGCAGPPMADFGYYQRRGDPDFWVVNVIQAYQSGVGSDGDGDDEPRLAGRAFPAQAVVVLFLEVLRDARAFWLATGVLQPQDTQHSAMAQCTVTHELAHLLGATHADGGTMVGMQGSKYCLPFSGQSLRTMRSSVTAGGAN